MNRLFVFVVLYLTIIVTGCGVRARMTSNNYFVPKRQQFKLERTYIDPGSVIDFSAIYKTLLTRPIDILNSSRMEGLLPTKQISQASIPYLAMS